MHNLLYICFNRSDLVERSLSRLLELDWDNIIIYIDGARNSQEELAVVDTKNTVQNLLKGNNSNIEIFHRESNYGCRRNIEHALTYFFSKYKKGWVFEDDIYLENIDEFISLRDTWNAKGHLALFNPFAVREKDPLKVDFGYYVIWGWYLDTQININLSHKFKFIHFLKIIRKRGIYRGLRFCYTYYKTLLNRLDTWDSLYSNWCIQMNVDSYMCPKSLIQNIGFDERATHTAMYDLKLPEGTYSKIEWKKKFRKYWAW